MEGGGSGSTLPAYFLGFTVSFTHLPMPLKTHMILFTPLKTILGKYFLSFIDLKTEVQ